MRTYDEIIEFLFFFKEDKSQSSGKWRLKRQLLIRMAKMLVRL